MTEQIKHDGIGINKKEKRKKTLSYFIIFLLLMAFVTTLYWFFFIRGYEKTEDAYVAGNQVMISSQVNGNVAKIKVENMDFVHVGDVLLELDDTDLKLNFEQAQDTLASTVRQIEQLGFTVKQLQAILNAKSTALSKAKGDLQRREQLAKTGSIDKETLQHAKEAVAIAQADWEATQNQLAANQALLKDLPLREQPEVKKAVSALKLAWLNLQRCKIMSPVEGYVARRNVQVGQKVAVGSPLMAVISSQQMWVDANFKETQLKKMRIGQPVKLTFDFYGDDIEFEGKVSGIEMGTGSAFSILPAQNATGNWIKVVQRVPVRIVLDAEQIKQYPLRLGLSAIAEVNVNNEEGKTLRDSRADEVLYQTTVLDYDFSPVNQLVEEIIQANTHLGE